MNSNSLPNHTNIQGPRINCLIKEKGSSDPSILIQPLPTSNMLSWVLPPHKPIIDIWTNKPANPKPTKPRHLLTSPPQKYSPSTSQTTRLPSSLHSKYPLLTHLQPKSYPSNSHRLIYNQAQQYTPKQSSTCYKPKQPFTIYQPKQLTTLDKPRKSSPPSTKPKLAWSPKKESTKPTVTHVTKGRHHFKSPHLEANNPLQALNKMNEFASPLPKEDTVLKQ